MSVETPLYVHRCSSANPSLTLKLVQDLHFTGEIPEAEDEGTQHKYSLTKCFGLSVATTARQLGFEFWICSFLTV